eukprot:7897193-Alexandrium_andersonii.AAC.1
MLAPACPKRASARTRSCDNFPSAPGHGGAEVGCCRAPRYNGGLARAMFGHALAAPERRSPSTPARLPLDR